VKIPRTTYITSHVGPHPMHRDFVRALGFRIGRVDKRIRWLDRPRTRPVRYLSWLVNGIALDGADDAEIILSEGFQIPPPLHKALGLCRPGQLVVCHHVGEAPYFLATSRYSAPVQKAMLKLMRAYDAHICVGKEQERLVREVLGPGDWNVHCAYVAHVADSKRPRLAACAPPLETRKVLFVGSIYSDWRVHYKGLDLVADAFSRAHDKWSLTIVGISRAAFIALIPHAAAWANQIEFIEFTDDLPGIFEKHDLMILPARGDTFPTVVLEAMAAGLPVLVSTLTGNCEVVHSAEPSLVVEPSAESLSSGIDWYLNLEPVQRRKIGDAARVAAGTFTESASTQAFADTLNQIATHGRTG